MKGGGFFNTPDMGFMVLTIVIEKRPLSQCRERLAHNYLKFGIPVLAGRE